MNSDTIKGKWTELKGSVKQMWGDFTDDDLMEIEGNRDKLIGKIQQRYGKSKDAAETEAKDFYGRSGWDW